MSGQFYRLLWIGDLEHFIIPLKLDDLPYLLHFLPSSSHVRLYSPTRSELHSVAHQILFSLLSTVSAVVWIMEDVIIPEYNNCISLSLCHAAVSLLCRTRDPEDTCCNFLQDCFRNDHRHFSEHPLSKLHGLAPISVSRSHPPQIKLVLSRSITDHPQDSGPPHAPVLTLSPSGAF